VDVNQIRELIKVVELSDIAEVVVEEAGTKVTVRKTQAEAVPVVVAAAAPASDATAAGGASVPAAAPVAPAGERPGTWRTVIAPMVGTFYEAPAPGAEPFVRVGDTVAEGQPLCILEAMKLMNEIVAEEAGVIREVALGNGSPVEYGSVLFYYEPL